MINSQTQNPIRLNHVGFMAEAPKRFVLTDNKTGDNSFTVHWLYECDKQPREVYHGKLICEDKENGLWSGDFSQVTQQGDFFITAGGYTSRFFLIYDNAYNQLSRILLSYFTYQRCGSELGWAGKCHLDDGFIKETGEKVDLSGGYHQSGDLRKSPGGVSIGVLGMLRYAMKDKSPWGKTLFADEVKWACDYYVRTIQKNGAMYNTLNFPFGWGGRTFYKSAAPSSAQWCVTSILTLGSVYFKNTDKERSEKYLSTALRSWDYMNGTERSYEQYDHPDVTPRGMDQPSFYSLCKRDNSADMAYMAVVAADLYNATGDKKYLDCVKQGADKLISLMGDGDVAMCVLTDDGEEHLAFMYNNYSHSHGGFMALCAACELLEDNTIYIEALKKVTSAICKLSSDNPWHIYRAAFSDADLDMRIGLPAPGRYIPSRRETLGKTRYIGSVYNNGKEIKCHCGTNAPERVSPNMSSTAGVFLMRAAKILGDKKAASFAQSQIDAVLGCNMFDASHVNGVGQNQVSHKPYGQFFPPVPHIPGAINIGFNSIRYDEYSEYDMPCVGMFMFLLSEYLG